MNDFTNGEFEQNIARVNNLINAYQELERNNLGEPEFIKDVLRAAIAFLHSTLEEVIRNLYLHRLPNGNIENLNKIPFCAHESSHRPKQILLGELINYRGKFVENIIYDSIEKYVNTMSINNTTQLVDYLKIADITIEPLKKYFSELDMLMARRHQIVHQMDRINDLDPLTFPITDIDIDFVRKCVKALCGFTTEIMTSIPENIAMTNH